MTRESCGCEFNNDNTIRMWCGRHVAARAVANVTLGAGPDRVQRLEDGLRRIAQHPDSPEHVREYVSQLLATPTTAEALAQVEEQVGLFPQEGAPS